MPLVFVFVGWVGAHCAPGGSDFLCISNCVVEVVTAGEHCSPLQGRGDVGNILQCTTCRGAHCASADGQWPPLQPHHEFLLLYGTHRASPPTKGLGKMIGV